MQKIFVMYKLKEGVSIESYRKWSRAVDQQITPRQPGVHSFKVYEITGSKQQPMPFQIVEAIEADNWAEWQKTVKSEGMARVVQEAADFVDPTSTVVVYGDQI